MLLERKDIWIILTLAILVYGPQSVIGADPVSGSVPEVTSTSYSTELETTLKKYLLSNYETLHRPAHTVSIMTSLVLMTLNSLDIKEQTLSMTLYFHFNWEDSRLIWDNNETFANIEFIYASEYELWTPGVIVENAIEDFDVISKPNVILRVENGIVTWTPAGIYKTYCESDITYWPLDDQTCDVKLSTWGYTFKDIKLELDKSFGGIITTAYQGHGEWDLVEVTSSSKEVERDRKKFSRLTFSFHFRRRPLFHMMNTLFPVVIMGFLTVTVFKLSPESGERISLSLTTLLAYAVYLTVISQSIPQTSTSTCLLSTYLASILFLQAISVTLTVFYLDMYFTPEDRTVPKWLQALVGCCLAKISRLECSRTRKNREISPTKSNKINIDAEVDRVEVINHNADNLAEMNTIVDESLGGANGTETDVYTWKEIALIFDKITMYMYLILVTGLTVICMGRLIYNV